MSGLQDQAMSPINRTMSGLQDQAMSPCFDGAQHKC